MECNIKVNLENCPCTYEGCKRKGMCCICLKSHLAKRALPACCFPKDVEATYDRTFEKFVECVKEGKI